MLFINCIPTAILEEKNDQLYPAPESRVGDLVGEYMRRNYKGCNNETLDFNSSINSILYQMPSRYLQAEGKIAALEREAYVKNLKDQKTGIEIRLRGVREVNLVVLDSKIYELEEILKNLRKVKTERSIQMLSLEFDSKEFEAKELLRNYEKNLIYYYPAVAAFSNASIAIKNAKIRWGVEDEWVKNQARELMALDADLTILEKDIAIGNVPPAESFSAIQFKSMQLQQNALRRPNLLPPIYLYAIMFLTIVSVLAIIYIKLRTPKKVISEDVPKIRKLLAKLRGLEQEEEEMK
jgi:hypothetical protein